MGFLQLQRAGATLRCSAGASHCSGLSRCGARALGVRATAAVACGLSSCGLRGLECRLSSYGAWAQLLRGMWDPPGPGLEPMSPALASTSPSLMIIIKVAQLTDRISHEPLALQLSLCCSHS